MDQRKGDKRLNNNI